MNEVFQGTFTQQEPLPDAAIAAALEVMKSGRLHRYNLVGDEIGEVALLEQEFAAFTGAKYCLAVASGGYAMATSMRAAGVRPGDKVLTNAFTLAPVPGAIAGVGAIPVLVETTADLVIDLRDLESKIAISGSRVLLLSHMRGHICDMDRLVEICDAHGVTVIEDCAHTMGATWNGVPSGRQGLAGCYSTQTYKHLNSGEGGLLVSDDDEFMARAIVLSGSYMLYGRHTAAPTADVFEKVKMETPNTSGRMDALRAAILRPQLQALPGQIEKWNDRYRTVEAGLIGIAGLDLISRPDQEAFVGSSIQFLLPDWPQSAVNRVINTCQDRGVELKWFGAEEPVAFTSKYDSWRYFETEGLPQTDAVMAGLLDMRLPLTFSIADCEQIARIIRDEVSKAYQSAMAAV